MSKHDGDFYCLHCLWSIRTNKKLESHKKVIQFLCDFCDFCVVLMPSEDTKTLRY